MDSDSCTTSLKQLNSANFFQSSQSLHFYLIHNFQRNRTAFQGDGMPAINALTASERTTGSHCGGGNDSSPLRSVYTANVPELLASFQVSIVISTYQAGYLIALRNDGGRLNTHFRSFTRPMGLAVQGGMLAVGCAREIVIFHDMAALAAKLDESHQHDACYLPRRVQITGDVDVHELAFGVEDLWFVNTRFSSLCTLGVEHSFIPRWRPPFVSALASDDRCHLNGLAMSDGRPRYVAALGATDSAEGWRTNRARGGVVLDVDSNEVVAANLSMPHSPRWHAGRLWVLESGEGSVGTVDLSTGRYEALAMLGGFTRGLAFVGPYALVGLSQVRDSSTFGGLPLQERIRQRICGVSVVDTRSGREVGYVRFEDAVQEVFAVDVLPSRWPEILEPGDDRLNHAYALPDAALREVVPSADRKTNPGGYGPS
jgi:uncharacterized protein (TIGR03032 family)